MTNPSLWERAEDFVSTPVGDGIVILDLRVGRYYSFSQTGAAIWTSLGQPKPVTAIVDALVEEFDVPAEACAMEVESFLTHLLEKKLVRQVE